MLVKIVVIIIGCIFVGGIARLMFWQAEISKLDNLTIKKKRIKV